LIDPILKAIATSNVATFDVTSINFNVLFELGYAIGTNRRLWLLRDPSVSKEDWDAIAFLTTLGYSPYVNSDDIESEFFKQVPHLAERTVYESSIVNALGEDAPSAVFYLKALYETDAESGESIGVSVRRVAVIPRSSLPILKRHRSKH
jgi:hypothetical protein